jgi:hypothetical protein
MGPKIGAAVHVGRIGAMAATLAFGAAVAAGQGVAWANTSGTGTSAPDSASSAGASASGTDAKSTSTAKPKNARHPAPAAAGSGGETASNSAKKTGKKSAARRAAPASSTPKSTAVDQTKSVQAAATGSVTKVAVQRATASNNAPQPTVRDTTVQVTKAAASVVTALPVAVPAPVPAKALQAVPRLISGVLAAVGFAPPAANTPIAPAEPPMQWALLAAARKEFEHDTALVAPTAVTQAVATAAVTQAAATAVVPTAAVSTVPTSLPSTPVGWVTGQNNGPLNGTTVPQTNNTSGFNIYGTDLGIMWDNEQSGATHYILTAFGDTFSGPNMTGDWRSNVLVLSQDTKLYNGMSLLPTGPTFQFIPSAPGALGLGGSEVTIIPTSGVAVLGNQYVNYMSVKSWDTPGRWTTNYSAISEYDPTTDKWVLVPSTIRSASWFGSSTPYVPGSQNFQQAAYVLEPEDQVGADGIRYLYAFGTPSGRAGSAYVSRVAEDDVTDLSQYQYWNGSSWVTGTPVAATPVIGDSTSSAGLFGFIVDWANNPNVLGGYLGGLFGAKTGGNVSEMSVQYNDYLDKYIVMYADGNNNVQMRTADTPEGPWSAPITVATSAQYPGLYAPMIHPWSGTGELTDNSDQPDLSDLYWNMSISGDYNVVMMQTDLSSLKVTEV